MLQEELLRKGHTSAMVARGRNTGLGRKMSEDRQPQAAYLISAIIIFAPYAAGLGGRWLFNGPVTYHSRITKDGALFHLHGAR